MVKKIVLLWKKIDFLIKFKFVVEFKFKGVNDVSLESNWYFLFNFVLVIDVVMF